MASFDDCFYVAVVANYNQWDVEQGIEPRMKSMRFYIPVANGSAIPIKRKTVRERTRKRHDPGDGPYSCRIASGEPYEVLSLNATTDACLSWTYERTRGPGYKEAHRFLSFRNGVLLEALYAKENTGPYWYASVRSTSFEYDRPQYFRRHIETISETSLTEEQAMWYYAFGKSIATHNYATKSDPLYYVGRASRLSFYEQDVRLSSQLFGPAATREAGYFTRNHEIGLASAFVDACDHLPTSVGINNIANVIDFAKALLGLSQGFSGLGKLSEAWLAYRYSYTTTVADLREMSEFADRLMFLPGSIRSNGYHRNGEFEYRCCVRATSEEIRSLSSAGERWGLKMSASNAWDLIPYSFIVDWFIPVSRTLERWESSGAAMRMEGIYWCSIRRQFTNEYGFDEADYTRFQYVPNASEANLSRTSYGTRAVTIVKRAIDALALFAK